MLYDGYKGKGEKILHRLSEIWLQLPLLMMRDWLKCLLCEHTPMKDNIFGSEAFILLTEMEMHYRRNEFQNFLQNLALDAHDGLHRKSTLALHPPLLVVFFWGGGE